MVRKDRTDRNQTRQMISLIDKLNHLYQGGQRGCGCSSLWTVAGMKGKETRQPWRIPPWNCEGHTH